MRASIPAPIAFALGCAQPAALAAPVPRGESAMPGMLAPGQALEYVLGVVTVMLALGAFVFVMRRLQQRQGFGGGLLRVCATLPLGGKERLLLVEAEGERLLLGVSPGGVHLVRRLSPARSAAPEPATGDGRWLSRVLNGEGIR